jgi:uncharacterized Rmd1/YagE family protein
MIPARAFLLAERLDVRGLDRARATPSGAMALTLEGSGHAFAFRWGAVVVIDMTEPAVDALLAALRPRMLEPLAVPVEEDALIKAPAESDGPDASGVIHLRDLAVPRLAILAEALAKSAALSHQEVNLARTLDRLDPIATRLSQQGRLGVSSRALLRSIGEALAARSRAGGRVDTAAKSELLWDSPDLAPLYTALAEEWELRERTEALEGKLVMVHETSQTLLSLLEARQSRGIEIAVMLLIATEVATTLYGLFKP